MSRPPLCLLKPPRSRPQKWGRDTKPPPCSLNHVMTSNRCRDTTQSSPGRYLKNDVATSNQLSPISATSRLHFPCRDLPCCHPCRDLPCCHPCRDLKVMSRLGAKKNRSRAQRPIRGRALALLCALLRAQLPLPCALAAFLSQPQH